ncbi:hypothetical protein BOX15_Mlig003893g1 [Macrostomum lignano]|uniref:Uncharacterized protein n=1 Tax=Macrostomum lignano TaxID=282301 RepID=A0A267FIP0_9PLAT|nr:hypothetical protein BOX15_Mlig003893g1 [Macrostomum lignano]
MADGTLKLNATFSELERKSYIRKKTMSREQELPLHQLPVSRIRALRKEWGQPSQLLNSTHRWATILLIIIFLILVACFLTTTTCLYLDRGLFCTSSSSPSAVEDRRKLQWSEWTQCSSKNYKCGIGDRFRFSDMNSKDPDLIGIRTIQIDHCIDSNDCPQRGSWAQWMEWSNCTCGPFGLHVRQRECLNTQNVVTDITKCDGMFPEVKKCSSSC